MHAAPTIGRKVENKGARARRFVGRGLDPALQSKENGYYDLKTGLPPRASAGRMHAAPTIGRKVKNKGVRVRRFVGRGQDPAVGCSGRQGRYGDLRVSLLDVGAACRPPVVHSGR